jgi:CYTH domain-containing protein
MPKEIERKFLVKSEAWRADAGAGELYRQGYLSIDKARTVRVRVAGGKAWVTIKGLSDGPSRDEYEYSIPADEAREMIDHLCLQPIIAKTRYRVPRGDLVWEIDEFEGENEGLVVAEIELPSADTEFMLPAWAGIEVTDDPRYFNSSLILHPYTRWS